MIEQCIDIVRAQVLVNYGQMMLVGAGLLLGATAATLYRRWTRGRKYNDGK